jgi:TolA-binding protein
MASPQSADELYSHALSDYTKGNYESAINGFRSIVDLYPNFRRLPNARYWLGESYYSQKNYDQAIKEFELLIKQFPKSQEAKRAKGRLSQVR